jgi:pre-mRNA-processing factor 19
MFCCISGQVPTEPVVSKTSGCLFERRLIEKFVSENGRCPKTGEPLTKDDLLSVSAGDASTLRVTPSQATIPGLLQSLHHEWDAMMLEQFTLRQQVAQVQQELSHALFQHDAACRVIAKLIQERDALKKRVAGGGGTSASSAKRNDDESKVDEEDEDDETPALPLIVCDAIDEHERRLQQQRKRRDPPVTLAQSSSLQKYVEFDFASVHGNNAVTALAVSDMQGHRTAVSGGADGKIVRYDLARRAVCGTGVGHRKAVRAIKDIGDIVVSASDDTTVRAWRSESGVLTSHAVIKAHQAPVNDLAVLPTEQHVISVDDAGKLILSDIAKGFAVATADSEHSRLGMSCVGLHPDGAVAASGSAGSVLLWDLRMMDVHVKLTPPGRSSGSITALAFNEDGVTLAASTSNSVVVLWDFRKVNEPLAVLTMSGVPAAKAVPINDIAFDGYGNYLAIGMDTVRLWNWRERTELATLGSHIGPVTGVAWGADAKWLASSSLDKTVRFYGME